MKRLGIHDQQDPHEEPELHVDATSRGRTLWEKGRYTWCPITTSRPRLRTTPIMPRGRAPPNARCVHLKSQACDSWRRRWSRQLPRGASREQKDEWGVCREAPKPKMTIVRNELTEGD
jgi:hypothetical protein